MKKQKIPRTDSIQELANFWDTHDLTDFEDQLETVAEPIFERETAVLKIPLLPREAEAVKQIAKAKGVSSIELLQKWVLEKIHTSTT